MRLARLEDASAIVDFQLAMALETEGMHLDKSTVEKGVAAVFADPNKGRYFVATDGEKILGSLLTTYEWSDWRNGVVWWIHSLYLVPEARGKGLYSEMYRGLQKLVADDPGIRGFRLYVEHKNTHAQKVYGQLGMTDEHYKLFEWLKT